MPENNKTYVWKFKREHPDQVYFISSPVDLTPTLEETPPESWTFQMTIITTDAFYISMTHSASMTAVPEFIRGGRLEVHFGKSFVTIDCSSHKLNKTKNMITFPTQIVKGVKEFQASLLKQIEVKFVYQLDSIFTWELLLKPKERNASSAHRLVVPAPKRSFQIWTFHFHFNSGDGVIQLSMSPDKPVKSVPEFIQNARFELTYHSGQLLINGTTSKLKQSGVTFATHKISIEKLTNNFRTKLQIKFIYFLKTSSMERNYIPASIEQTHALDQSHKPSGPKVNKNPDIAALSPLICPPNPQTSPVLQDLNELLVNQERCDVIFDCKGTRIGAHQTVLECRCPFFKSFLQNDVPFIDVDAETLIDVLQYIYTGCAPNVAKTAERLMRVADMIAMPGLKEVAQRGLVESMKMNMVLTDMRKLTSRFHEKEMQPKIMDFVLGNMDDLMSRPWFEEVLKERPDICYEILRNVHQTRVD